MITSEFGSALINHLWQSTVVVAIAWLLTLALRKNHARVRYWVWFAASVKFLLPFSLLVAAGEWVRTWVRAATTRPAVADAMGQMAQPFPETQFLDATEYRVAAHHANWLPVVLFAVWICGALVVAIRFGRGWWNVYVAKRAARALGTIGAGEWFECDGASGAKAHHSLNSLIGTTEVVPFRKPRLDRRVLGTCGGCAGALVVFAD